MKEQHDIYPYCTSQEFKKELKELCDSCPIKHRVEKHIPLQIIHQAQEKKEVLTAEQFQNYINEEVKNAGEAMDKAYLAEMQRNLYWTSKDSERAQYSRSKCIGRYIWNKERIKALNQVLQSSTDVAPPTTEKSTDSTRNTPQFREDVLPDCLSILKPYFDKKDHIELKKLLTNSDAVAQKLAFLEAGNKLAYAFRQLKEIQVITGCDKKELQNWIAEHFTFRDSKTKAQVPYQPFTLEGVISGNRHCKNPILKAAIVDGKPLIEPVVITPRKSIKK